MKIAGSDIFSLYTDGSQSSLLHRAGTGFWIANPGGSPIMSQSAEIDDPVLHPHFELLAIFQGIKKAYEMGIRRLVCYCDCEGIVDKLHKVLKNSLAKPPRMIQPAVMAIYGELIKIQEHFSLLEFSYLPRCKNGRADKLSRQYLKIDSRQELNRRLESAKVVFGHNKDSREYFAHPVVQYAPLHFDRSLSGKMHNAHKRSFVDEIAYHYPLYLKIGMGKSARLPTRYNISITSYQKGKESINQLIERRPHEHGWDCALRGLQNTFENSLNLGVRSIAFCADNIDFNLLMEGWKHIPESRLKSFRGLYSSLNRFERVCIYPMDRLFFSM